MLYMKSSRYSYLMAGSLPVAQYNGCGLKGICGLKWDSFLQKRNSMILTCFTSLSHSGKNTSC